MTKNTVHEQTCNVQQDSASIDLESNTGGTDSRPLEQSADFQGNLFLYNKSNKPTTSMITH